MEVKTRFVDYSDALEWIKTKSKEFKSSNDFYASEEYKSVYHLIKELHKVEQSNFAKKGMSELAKANLNVGDKVVYDYVSLYFTAETYTGIIFEKNGIPYVQFDKGQKTMSGKNCIRWHKGFTRAT